MINPPQYAIAPREQRTHTTHGFTHPSPSLSCIPSHIPFYKGFSTEIFVQTGTANGRNFSEAVNFTKSGRALELPDKSMQSSENSCYNFINPLNSKAALITDFAN
ncbi:hypothetical protein TNIN_319081 [Trichonephila inaurata madagascariensis]|uniref:Uncharacterized protein n=1 Tax=Trichonephila inaurata madagascariensis TaxID=2747483 RepID=A0A8X6JUP3_9ARAC|nr:hypothetical protein TNIN_319081 [Trichonephila inaurata madagascariensis]